MVEVYPDMFNILPSTCTKQSPTSVQICVEVTHVGLGARDFDLAPVWRYAICSALEPVFAKRSLYAYGYRWTGHDYLYRCYVIG